MITDAHDDWHRRCRAKHDLNDPDILSVVSENSESVDGATGKAGAGKWVDGRKREAKIRKLQPPRPSSERMEQSAQRAEKNGTRPTPACFSRFRIRVACVAVPPTC